MARKKAKANKKIYTRVETKKPPIDKKRALIIFVCIFLGAVILAGAIAGIAIAARNASYLISDGGVGINEGVANYLTSYYKTSYMKFRNEMGVPSVEDTEEFWSLVIYNNADGTKYTYGDDLKNYITLSIKSLIASNKLFNTHSRLTAEDKQKIKSGIEEILEYRAHGSVAQFNENVSIYGYDYKDFCDATELLYKAGVVEERICGVDGAGMKASADKEITDYLATYYMRYSHVNLIFIRTNDTFELDEEGNRIRDEKNNDKLRPLTDAEKAERQERIAKLDACIAGIKTGEVAPERFFELMNDYDEGDTSTHNTGYYFYYDSAYTQEFSQAFKDVVENAEYLYEGECAKVNVDFGVCYIYKYAPAESAYKNTDEHGFFSDFYKLAAADFFTDLIEERRELVKVKEKWNTFDVLAIPYGEGKYVVGFSK